MEHTKIHRENDCLGICRKLKCYNEGEQILSALREKPLKIFDVMKRANISNQEACQALLLWKCEYAGSGEVRHHRGNGSSLNLTLAGSEFFVVLLLIVANEFSEAAHYQSFDEQTIWFLWLIS